MSIQVSMYEIVDVFVNISMYNVKKNHLALISIHNKIK